MSHSTAIKSVITLAFFLLLQLASAAPVAPIMHLSTGWSGHSRRSTMDASIKPAFTTLSAAEAGCTSACAVFAVYDATCDGALYEPECNMCSTQGLDSYIQCSNCLASSANATVTHTELASTLSLMERVCESYTRTALPSLTLNVKVPDAASSATSSGAPAFEPRVWAAFASTATLLGLASCLF